MEKNQKRNDLQLSGMQLKYIAMVCMLLDHVADGIILPLMKAGVTDALYSITSAQERSDALHSRCTAF